MWQRLAQMPTTAAPWPPPLMPCSSPPDDESACPLMDFRGGRYYPQPDLWYAFGNYVYAALGFGEDVAAELSWPGRIHIISRQLPPATGQDTLVCSWAPAYLVLPPRPNFHKHWDSCGGALDAASILVGGNFTTRCRRHPGSMCIIATPTAALHQCLPRTDTYLPSLTLEVGSISSNAGRAAWDAAGPRPVRVQGGTCAP